ncbi:MAG: response regulator [Planctomycetaceae bacterium]
MTFARRICLLLVDDHPVMRAGLANLLASEADFSVVAQADDGDAAYSLWQQHAPDVTLLDLAMHGTDGIATLHRIRRSDPAARVLVLTSAESQEDAQRSLDAGASGYVTKHVGHKELFEAIRSVHAGGRPVQGVVRVRPAAAAAGPAGLLTPRELEVIGLLREGFTNNEIAKLLGISTHTAKAHVAGVIEKLGVGDRTQAVARAFDLGLLTAAPSRGQR